MSKKKYAQGRYASFRPAAFLAAAALLLLPSAAFGMPAFGTDEAGDPAPNRMIVRYRDGLTRCAHGLHTLGRPFKHALTDGSDSLDRLHQRHGVRRITPVFRRTETLQEIEGQAEPLTLEQARRRIGPKMPHRLPGGRGDRAANPGGSAPSELAHCYVVNLAPGADIQAACRAFEPLPKSSITPIPPSPGGVVTAPRMSSPQCPPVDVMGSK